MQQRVHTEHQHSLFKSKVMNKYRSVFTYVTMLGLGVGCSQPSPTKPNVLVVTWDTVRADRVASNQTVAPFYHAMSEQGVVFRHARTTAPLTLPAHGSLLTGLYPHEHGLRHNVGFTLDEKHLTLAERFNEAGWKTGGFVSVTVLDKNTGIHQGFHHYDDAIIHPGDSSHFPERNGQKTMQAALDWIDTIASSEPIFLWVHFYDPHRPWTPTFEQAQNQSDTYDAEIFATDTYTRELFNKVTEHAQNRDTVMAITSDHGESNGEHGESTHGWFAYESCMRIPMLVWDSSQQSKQTIDQAVDLIDLHNGLSQVAAGKRMVITPRDSALLFESATPLFELGAAPIQGIKEGDLVGLQSPVPEVYNIQKDPQQKVNIYSHEAHHKLLTKTPPAAEVSKQKTVSPAVQKQLESLGYISTNQEQNDNRPDAKDLLPLHELIMTGVQKHGLSIDKMMAQIETMETTIGPHPMIDKTKSMIYAQAGKTSLAIKELKNALQKSPTDETNKLLLSQLENQITKNQALLKQIERAIQQNPSPNVLYDMALTLHRLERWEEAEAYYQKLLTANPNDLQGVLAYSKLLRAKGKPLEAISLLSKHPALKCEQARALYEGQKVEPARLLFLECWKEGRPLNERETKLAFEGLIDNERHK